MRPFWKVVIDGDGHGFFARENPTEQETEVGFSTSRDYVAYVTTDDPTEAVREAYARRRRELH